MDASPWWMRGLRRTAVVSGRFDLGGLSPRIAHAVEQVKGKQLFLDPIDALFQEFSEAVDVRRAFADMLRELRSLGVTTLIAAERPGDEGVSARYEAEEFVVENIVILGNNLVSEHRAGRSRSSRWAEPSTAKECSPSSSTDALVSKSCPSR